MIAVAELGRLVRARLRDAEVLFGAKRYDGAVYLVGYAVEIALKRRICRTLKWPGFPETRAEFEGYASFRTHRLGVLLRLSAREEPVKTKHLVEWSVISAWDPETRYRQVGAVQKQDARLMIDSAKSLLKAL